MSALLSKASKKRRLNEIHEEASANSTTTGFGAKMLSKYGWTEGQGLGLNKQGITERVTIHKKRDESAGIGFQTSAPTKLGTLDPVFADPFASSSLQDFGNRPSESDSSDDDSEDDEDEKAKSSKTYKGMDLSKMTPQDREMFIKCGGRRLGRRAGREQKGKWDRELKADGGETPEPEEREKEKKDKKKKKKKKRSKEEEEE